MDITDRCFQFAVRIIRLCRELDDLAGVYWVVSRQLAKSGTSIGANIEEAQGAQRRADFNAKMYISLKESRETLYWLRLLIESELVPAAQLIELTEESDQLVRILTTITRKTRKAKRIRN
jgi:four helix bundle protein